MICLNPTKEETKCKMHYLSVGQVEFSSSSESSNEECKIDIDEEAIACSEKIILNDIGELAEICKSKYGSKYLTTLLYLSLRYFNIK